MVDSRGMVALRALLARGGSLRAPRRFGQWKPLGPTARGADARPVQEYRRWCRAVADALQACAQSL